MIKRFIYNCVWVLTYFIYWPTVRLFYSVKIDFDPSLYQKKSGPVIIISNHKTIFDPWHISGSVPFFVYLKLLPIRMCASKKFTQSAAIKMNSMGITNIIYFLFNVLVIPSNADFEGKITPYVNALKNHESLFIFPEGRLVVGDQINEFKRGVVEIHRRTELPILPVSTKIIKEPGKRNVLKINFGPLTKIPPEILSIANQDELHRQGSEFLRSKVVELYNTH